MGRSAKIEFRAGEYWIARRPNSPRWFRCWYDKITGQVQRVSLRTSSFDEAKQLLTQWFLAQQQGPKPPEELPISLAEVLTAYFEAHGKNLASVADVKGSSQIWIDYFGDISAVDACEVDRLAAFRTWLADRGYSPGYINRIISVGRAALLRAFERRQIAVRPVVRGVPTGDTEPRGRPLSIVELRALLKCATQPHLTRFILLGLATGARPDALRELQWSSIHLDERVIALNPPGRRQNKKRRPRIPICNELLKLLHTWGQQDAWEGPVIRFKSEAVTSIRTTWRGTRKRCGFGQDVNPYSLRHTVAKWLRSQGVTPWEVAALLGHKMPGFTVTEIYAEADPAYMAATRNALDKLLAGSLQVIHPTEATSTATANDEPIPVASTDNPKAEVLCVAG